MRRVLTWLLVAAAAIAVAWWVAELPGKVAISVAGLSFEASAPVAVLLGAITLVLLYFAIRAIGFVMFLPRRLRQWNAARHRRSGDAAVTRALVTLAAAEGRAARSASAKARRLLGDTPQTLLLAAEAARLDNDEDAAARIFQLMAERPDAAFLGLRGLFRQATARGDWTAAQQLARQAEAIQPGASWLRQARLELAARTGDWLPALGLAGPDAPLAALATAASGNALTADEGEKLARRAFRADPAFVPAALAYATRLRAAGREGKALEVLREAWTNAAHPALAELALAPVHDALGRVRAATGLVKQRPDHPESHLLLCRLSLAAGLTGEARRHAKAALATGAHDRRAFMLLADIEAGEGGNHTAAVEALRHAASAEPEPAWICGNCKAEQPQWHPACPACHAPASLVWGRRTSATPVLTADAPVPRLPS